MRQWCESWEGPREWLDWRHTNIRPAHIIPWGRVMNGIRWLAGALLSVFLAFVQAADYPTKPVRIIVASGPGGGTPEQLRKRDEHWMGIFEKIAKDAGAKPQ